MTSNVLCKYFMNGACAFGDQCRFSHNRHDEPTQVCKYYLAGNCAYGDRCRYMHSKPSWSSRGQPAPPSNYTAPTGVYKPSTGPEAAPNWDDFMTPDEMDEFEQWQEEQQLQAQEDDGDIMDPADIPLCQEFAATGCCSAGEDCLYIHGDLCEICGYYCAHPYNPDWTAQHKAACKQAMAAAAAAAVVSGNGIAEVPEQQQNGHIEETAVAAGVEIDDQPAASMETSSTDVGIAAAADSSTGSSTDAVKTTVAAAVAAVIAEDKQQHDEAAADGVADQLAATKISS